VIRAEGLSKRLGDFSLRDISFAVAQGEYAVLLGPTASGKTVLLETVVGINRPDAGSVWLDGQDVTHAPPERRGIGFVYQRSMLFPNLSVWDNIAYGLRYHGVERADRAARVEHLADLLDIAPLLRRSIHGLSGGEMQKVALARALAIEPHVLLLDEPLAPLDPLSKELLRTELQELHHKLGTTIVHVTHDQETARVLGAVIGVMRHGQLLQFGPKDEVFDRPASAFVARFLGIENVLSGRAAPDGELARIELGCGSVVARTDREGRVGLCVRPELIAIAPAEAALPAATLNRIQGVVQSISDRGALVRYLVAAADDRFVVLQPKREYADAAVRVGQHVALSFDVDAVHVFPRWSEHHLGEDRAEAPAQAPRGACPVRRRPI